MTLHWGLLIVINMSNGVNSLLTWTLALSSTYRQIDSIVYVRLRLNRLIVLLFYVDSEVN